MWLFLLDLSWRLLESYVISMVVWMKDLLRRVWVFFGGCDDACVFLGWWGREKKVEGPAEGGKLVCGFYGCLDEGSGVDGVELFRSRCKGFCGGRGLVCGGVWCDGGFSVEGLEELWGVLDGEGCGGLDVLVVLDVGGWMHGLRFLLELCLLCHRRDLGLALRDESHGWFVLSSGKSFFEFVELVRFLEEREGSLRVRRGLYRARVEGVVLGRPRGPMK